MEREINVCNAVLPSVFLLCRYKPILQAVMEGGCELTYI